MARRSSSNSRLRSAINQYNRKVREYNNKRKRAIADYNREVRQYNTDRRSAIDAYNRGAREYNRRVRANRARLQSARLIATRRQPVVGHYYPVHRSAVELSDAYDRLDYAEADPYLSDLAERETVNSLTVVNSLLGEPGSGFDNGDDINTTKITHELSAISLDLNDRWHGALFALNPTNPDAARHFCTSSREIITGILNSNAPDDDVLDQIPNCPLTERGTPTRRAKIAYCLDRLGVANDDLEGFIDTNVRDLSVLFDELNAGAHGPAGKFSMSELASIKTRVEDTVAFMCEIAS